MIYNLHVLRIFAALAVVYVHVCSPAGLDLDGIGAGSFGVDVFFVISGFTMSYVGQMPAGAFALRRLIRIVPFYWTASVGTYLLALIDPTKVQSSSASLAHLLHSLFFIPHVNKVNNLDPILALGWSLNYEMYFYALFAVALLFSIKWAPVVCSGMMVAIATFIRLTGTHNRVFLFYAEPVIAEFVAGIAVFYLVNSEAFKQWNLAHAKGVKAVLLAAAGISTIALPWQELTLHGERALRAGPWAFILVLAAILLDRHFGRAIQGKSVLLLGDASYVLYLTHPYVVYGIIRLVLSRVSLNRATTGLAVIGLLIMPVLVAIGVHVLFERPVMAALRRALLQKRSSRDPAVAPQVASGA